MCSPNGCVEVFRDDEQDAYYLFDTKDRTLDPLVVYDPDEYGRRYDLVLDSGGDSSLMFDSPEQYRTLSSEELQAFGAYICAGVMPREFPRNYQSMVAFSDQRLLLPHDRSFGDQVQTQLLAA